MSIEINCVKVLEKKQREADKNTKQSSVFELTPSFNFGRNIVIFIYFSSQLHKIIQFFNIQITQNIVYVYLVPSRY